MSRTHQGPAKAEQIRPIQLVAVGNLPQIPAPFIRVSTCGLLTIEIVAEVVSVDPPRARYVSLTPEQLRGRGTTPALMLLKLLLNRYEHFASKDWLLEQFCRDGEQFASARIENIVSLLRGLLCPPAYQDLRTHLVAHVRSSISSGDGYQLALYPLVWVDSEALAWNVEQAARMERFGDDGLPFWERAYDLAKRGPYLPDEMYSEWATFRRDEVAGLLRQTVQALARLYVARHGAAGEEEALLLLRSFWQEHPHEEDVLRALMELLGHRERYHEALQYYERFQKLLAQDDQEPTAQTQDVAAYVRAKQVQRVPLATASEKKQILMLKDRLAPVTSADAIIAIEQHAPGTNFTQDRSFQHTSLVVPEDTLMTSFDGSRRLALQQLLGLASAATSTPLLPSTNASVYPFKSPLHVAQDTLEIFADLLETCWELSQGRKLKAADAILWSHLPRIAEIALQFPHHQQKAANLAAQGYILAASLVGHRNSDLYARQYFSEQALIYAQIAQDSSLQVAALRALGVTFDYQKRPVKVLDTYQQTLPHLNRVSPLLRGRMYALLAGAYAKVGQKQEAFAFLDQAYSTFPDKPQDDPSFRYADAGRFTLIIWDGAVHLDTSQPKQALEIFLRTGETVAQKETFPKRIQSEILIYQTRAWIMLKDLEAASTFLKEAMKEAQTIQSEVRYQQAYELFSQMQTLWPQEPSILSLRENFLR